MLKMLSPLVALAIFSLLMPNQLVAEEYIVKLKYSPKKYDLERLSKYTNNLYKISGVEEGLNLIKVDTKASEHSDNLIQMLKEYFDAEYVVPNIEFKAFIGDLDPRRAEQWALDITHADQAWAISLGSSRVIVAVIDTGLASNHEDLKSNVWINPGEKAGNGIDDDNNGYIDDVAGWDFHSNDNNPDDETGPQNPGHGTHCSGIIGAVCGNNIGICGISPEVSIMPLRFLDKDGSGDLFASTQAIEYAVKNGAHIISASWGATIPESVAQPIIDAIKKAEEKGVIFVAAAANDGKSNDRESVYPANTQTPNMISVAASNSSDQKPVWSNYGRKVALAAPGENILSTIPGGYQKLSGTSMATPFVAGLVALMKSLDLSLSGAQARSILQSTGAQVNIETASNRRVDAHQALEAVKNQTLTLVPAAHTLKINDQYRFSAWGGKPPYKFNSLNPEIASSDEAGNVVAKGVGDATIEVVDSLGQKARSVSLRISDGSAPPGGGSECPLGDEFLCAIMCLLDPNLPWCNSESELELPPDLPLPFPLPLPIAE